MTIALIDYGSGNLHSAAKAIELQAADTGQQLIITDKPEEVLNASHIILPGVGAFADCLNGLLAVDGLKDALQEAVIQKGTWFLGICVGMQLMLETGYEHGTHQGLGWIEGSVGPIAPGDNLKIPHMGWNELSIKTKHPIFNDIHSGDHVYYVHSYHATCKNAADCLAISDYGGPISACIGKDNMIGTQFHPEKSHRIGLKLLNNFIRM
ncbi:MAG: imidazole glycerol phosphate synthase subunit HisH [Rickettsiales bacterium]|nr:imidazole glycerol phosphate synthase subunit HisH [Rickettsiales bacterium]